MIIGVNMMKLSLKKLFGSLSVALISLLSMMGIQSAEARTQRTTTVSQAKRSSRPSPAVKANPARAQKQTVRSAPPLRARQATILSRTKTTRTSVAPALTPQKKAIRAKTAARPVPSIPQRGRALVASSSPSRVRATTPSPVVRKAVVPAPSRPASVPTPRARTTSPAPRAARATPSPRINGKSPVVAPTQTRPSRTPSLAKTNSRVTTRSTRAMTPQTRNNRAQQPIPTTQQPVTERERVANVERERQIALQRERDAVAERERLAELERQRIAALTPAQRQMREFLTLSSQRDTLPLAFTEVEAAMNALPQTQRTGQAWQTVNTALMNGNAMRVQQRSQIVRTDAIKDALSTLGIPPRDFHIWPKLDIGYQVGQRSRSEQYGLCMPTGPLFHPYHIGQEQPHFTFNIKFPSYDVIKDFLPESLRRHLHGFNHPIDTFLIFQDSPWQQFGDGTGGRPDTGGPMRLRLASWVDPEAPTIDDNPYNKLTPVRAGVFSKSGQPQIETQTVDQLVNDGVSTHNSLNAAGQGDSQVVTSGPTTPLVNFDPTLSQMLFALAIKQDNSRAAVSINCLWNPADELVVEDVLRIRQGNQRPSLKQVFENLNQPATKQRLSPSGRSVAEDLERLIVR